ncbi:hypothetical protein LTI14_05475 [Nesterenkonia sp. YGD6]|uniref:hypothetical protein n=1 Tax=Nesterenkonia sp. YGD6 TaxID=2901231 RepID=UPI001F4CE714|nr:hypothetical protein [Nesterenkonia sp. YGD6]MCH8562670.1 hypothetical protein [Nesterenkonia sp. YGD6]
MTEKSQDESAETLTVAEKSGADTEISPASTEDSSAEDTSAERADPARKQDPATASAAPADASAPAESSVSAGDSSPAAGSVSGSDTTPAEDSTPAGDSTPAAAQSPTPAPSAPSVRWSRPTPARPAPSKASAPETDLSSFFDDLDEKFLGAARRVGAAFRRSAPQDQPGPDEQRSRNGRKNGRPASGQSTAGAAQSPPVTRPAAAPSNGVDHSGSALGSAARGPESSPLSLPRPRRALDEQRQRDVILEKAAAIEAATAMNHRPTDRDYIESADDEEDLFTYIPPYNMPSRDPDPAPVRSDLYRQIFVTLGALAALVSLIWMFGIFPGSPAILGGNGLDELAGGWYSGGQALLSPNANFYWLWPIIVLGLLAHAVHQWTTTQISTPRQRRSGWQVGSASLFMLIWTASIHHGMLTLAALASLAAALALIDAIRQFTFRTARTGLERRFSDTTTGLFTGWAMVAAMSSLSIWLTAMGWRVPGIPAVLWALLGLGICIWAAAYYAMTERGRIAVALGMGWGMFWLIFPRLLSDVTSVWVAISAAMGAFVVILATESRRHKINHAERRAAMGRPLEDII